MLPRPFNPAPAGNGPDVIGRIVADRLTQASRQPSGANSQLPCGDNKGHGDMCPSGEACIGW
jgi:hypothetical protein